MANQEISERLTDVSDFVRWGANRFERAGLHFGHGTDNAADEAAFLVASALGIDHECLATQAGRELTGLEKETVGELFHRRIHERRPAAYLASETWFAGLRFHVDERVLIPRSPIAELINERFEPWVDPEKVYRILDLCTGSGCIGIACGHAFPDATVDCTDISQDALAVATLNIAQHGLAERVRVVRSDLFAELGRNRYDLIVSNPPYVGEASLDTLPVEYSYEPRLGLAAGADGLDVVRELLARAAEHLSPHGVLVCEVGESAEALEQAFPHVPFVWLDFTRGGDGVFVLGAEELARTSVAARRIRDAG